MIINMIRKIVIGFLFSLQFSSFSLAYSEEYPWQLRIKKEDTTVYTRKVEGSPILEFKSDIIVSVPIDKAIALFEDEKRIPHWYYQCVSMELLEDEGPSSKIFYFVLNLPWPVAKRDSVFRRIKMVDSITGGITYELTVMSQRLPKQKGKIRVPYLKALWRFTPLKNGQTEIYFQQHGSTGGSIPTFITNALVLDIPFYSLQNFRRLVEEGNKVVGVAK